MEQLEETRYLPLDLLLSSSRDLSPIIDALGERVFVVYNGTDESGGFYAVIEPPAPTPEDVCPEDHARYMLGLIEELPASLMSEWLSCSSRIFDFGYQSGGTPHAISHDLDQVTLQRIGSTGINARITIYSRS